MSNKNSTTSGGVGFTGLLTIAFVVLKLCNVITWSWWWVLSPFLIPIGLLLIGLIVYWFILWYRSLDKKKRLASGMNEWAWRNRNKVKKKVSELDADYRLQSKWHERVEQIKKDNL